MTYCGPDYSASGVDDAPLTDPGKVWRCDGCGTTGTSAELDDPATHHDHDGLVASFGVCPKCETLTGVPSTPAQGQALADESITRAGAAAPDDWIIDARRILRAIAATGREFTTDDLWERTASPPEPRAMGAVIRWGVDQGLIRDTGRSRKSRRPECHARPVTIWTSTGSP